MLMAVEVCLELCVRVATMLQVYKTNAKLVATCAVSFFCSLSLSFSSSFSFQRAACGCTGFSVLRNGDQQLQPAAVQVYFLFFSVFMLHLLLFFLFIFYFLNCTHNKQLLTQKQRRMREITYSSQNVIRTSGIVFGQLRFDCKIPSQIMTAYLN